MAIIGPRPVVINHKRLTEKICTIHNKLQWQVFYWKTFSFLVCLNHHACICKIFRNLKHFSKTLKETAYTSFVRSVLDYSSTVWDPYLQKDIDRLESIQRRAARFNYNNYGRTTSVTEMMKKLDWKPLSERRREQSLIIM